MSRVTLAVVLLSLAPASGARLLPPTASFEEYVEFFQRSYGHDSEEGRTRRGIFEQAVEAIRTQNGKPNALWRAGFNELADRTPEELQGLRGWRATPRQSAVMLLHDEAGLAELPSDFPDTQDWSHLDSLVAPQQHSCGSCWAMASAYLLRAHYEIKTGTVREFAAQELVNCVPNVDECGGSGGCEGATVELAMAYVSNISLEGLSLDGDLPYTGEDAECNRGPPGALLVAGQGGLRGLRHRHGASGGDGVSLARYQTLPANKPEPLLRSLLDGPVAVSAASMSWKLYAHGIFDQCSDRTVDHAILMVGFGEDAGQKYWKIMNSWGTSWGENGMIRLARPSVDEANDCDWDEFPSLGTACKPYPLRQWVCGACAILSDSVTIQLA